MQESTLPISLEALHDRNRGRGVSSMTSGELLERLKVEERYAHMTEQERAVASSATRTEMSKRYSFSLASLAFALIGVPLAITAHRKETSVGFLLSLIVAITYFLFIIIANGFRDKPHLHPELLMWLPNLLCFGIGGWLFVRMSRR
jgi:lipopolysaccharide export system permease protein